MKKIYLSSLIFILLHSTLSPHSSAAEFEIKVGTIAPLETTYMRMASEAFREAERLTQDRLKFILYPGMSMGDEPDMIRKMRLDQLQGGFFTVLGISKMVPEMMVLCLPFLFKSVDEVDYLKESLFDMFYELFEKRGFILLAWLDVGGFGQMFSKNMIKTPEDLQQQDVWGWSAEPISLEFLKALNVTPIFIPLPEVLPALQTGMVNAVAANALGCVALQWHTQIRYVEKMDVVYGPVVAVTTKRMWDKTPDGIKEIIKKVIRKHEFRISKAVRRDDDIALVGMYKRGIKIVRFSEKELKPFKELTRPVWDTLVDQYYPRWLLDKIIKELESYRSGK